MILVSDPLYVQPTAPTVELTAYSNLWSYVRTAANGTGIQVGPNGTFSNVTTGGVTYLNGGVAMRGDKMLPPDQWVQVTLGAVQNISLGMAIMVRCNAAGSWLGLNFFGNGQTNLFASNAGAAPVSPVVSNTASAILYAAGDVIRLEIQTTAGVTAIRPLRAPAGTPTAFALIWNPGAVNAAGNSFLAATASGGSAGIGAFAGSATQSFIVDFAAGDFTTGPTALVSPTGQVLAIPSTV